MNRYLFWALSGGILATLLDALHAFTGTLAYPHTPLGLQDWWVPFEFAVAGIVVGESHRGIAAPMAGRVLPPPSMRELSLAIALFVGVYGLSGVFKAWPNAELIGFTALFVVALTWTPVAARPALLMHAAGCAIFGPLTEAGISALGLFHYLVPDVIGVPRWLPALYLHVALASAALDRWLISRRR